MATGTAVEKTHVERLTSSSRKEDLVKKLSDKFFIDEPAGVVRVLDTDFMYFMGDLDPRHIDNTRKRINKTLEDVAAFYNVEELNALLKLPPKGPNYTAALGLYLYFADECSRLKSEGSIPSDTTFLSEMRKEKVILKDGEEYSQQELHKRMAQVLKNLGMGETQEKILDDWCKTGDYKINGKLNNYIGDTDDLPGGYGRLARDIKSLSRYIPLNAAISYALGNMDNMAGKSEADACSYTESLTGPLGPHTYKAALKHPDDLRVIDPRILACIKKGDDIRQSRIEEKIREQMIEEWRGTQHGRNRHEAVSVAKSVFSHLPEAALEIFDNAGFNCALSTMHNISKSYPPKLLPGETQDDHDAFSQARGLCDHHYHTLFLSYGRRRNANELDHDSHLRSLVLAQTVMHEIMHMAISELPEEQREDLFKAVDALHQELEHKGAHKRSHFPPYFEKHLKTMATYKLNDGKLYDNTLLNTLEYTAPYYQKYRLPRLWNEHDEKEKWERKNVWREEMVCNLAGLMYSEFPYPPASGSPNPYDDLSTLKPLADKINAALETARGSSCQKFYTPSLSSQMRA